MSKTLSWVAAGRHREVQQWDIFFLDLVGSKAVGQVNEVVVPCWMESKGAGAVVICLVLRQCEMTSAVAH